MHAHMHAYMHTYMHTYTHTYIHTYIHAHVHTYMHYITYIKRSHGYLHSCVEFVSEKAQGLLKKAQQKHEPQLEKAQALFEHSRSKSQNKRAQA